MQWNRRKAALALFLLFWLGAAAVHEVGLQMFSNEAKPAVAQNKSLLSIPDVDLGKQGIASPSDVGYWVMIPSNAQEDALAHVAGTVVYSILYEFHGARTDAALSTEQRYGMEPPKGYIIDVADPHFSAMLLDLVAVCERAWPNVATGLKPEVDAERALNKKRSPPILIKETDHTLVTVSLLTKTGQSRNSSNDIIVNVDQFAAHFMVQQGHCIPYTLP